MRDICKKGIAKVQKSQLSGKYQPRITVSVSVMTYLQNMLSYCGELADQQHNIAKNTITQYSDAVTFVLIKMKKKNSTT